MPDWSYRTIFRPVLFRLPARMARDLALGFTGALARLPWGSAVIDFLGHMRADSRLRRSFLGVAFAGPVGVACDLDSNASASGALARFGVGCIEIGPVTRCPSRAGVERRIDRKALWYPELPANPGVEAMRQRLERWGRLPVPLLVRLGDGNDDDCREVMRQLGPYASILVLGTARTSLRDQWSAERCRRHVAAVSEAARGRPLLLALTPELAGQFDAWIELLLQRGSSGVVVDAVQTEGGGLLAGAAVLGQVIGAVQQLRQRWAHSWTIMAAGVHEPEDALELRAAGADLVQVSSGLVYSGPGLPKRVNDAWLYAEHGRDAPAPAGRAEEMSWFWLLLMGLSMLVGGALALAIASTRVVLHYDEVFSGMSRDQLDTINPRLLPFMAHDRVTLAGTMISMGVIYLWLSWFGIRQGLHWAKVSVLASAFAGFASFFLFLGFGYFDPFHAFVTAVLFQLLLLGLHGKLATPPARPANLREDWRWRWSQWAQLLLIIHNTTLIGAGCVISFIGATHVFVPEDLEFMQTTAEALTTANPRLVPLVAHDRASFGGMLIASGVALLLPALWGFRQGCRWLWWMFLLSAAPAYAAGIGVHFAVGYTNLWHLAPVIGGAVVCAMALALAWPYLNDKPQTV
jgi:dihydroorotate dehydrogenase